MHHVCLFPFYVVVTEVVYSYVLLRVSMIPWVGTLGFLFCRLSKTSNILLWAAFPPSADRSPTPSLKARLCEKSWCGCLSISYTIVFIRSSQLSLGCCPEVVLRWRWMSVSWVASRWRWMWCVVDMVNTAMPESWSLTERETHFGGRLWVPHYQKCSDYRRKLAKTRQPVQALSAEFTAELRTGKRNGETEIRLS